MPKELPPKWFYDARGSELFEEITRLPEYYPTRTERAILDAHADAIAKAADADTLVELGSGSSEKTRLLLDAMTRHGVFERYVPVDVSSSALEAAAGALHGDYPDLAVHGVVADFDRHFDQIPTEGRRLIAFLGGTIGNFGPEARVQFLSRLRASMRAGDGLLLGTDLVKSPERLIPAYDDAAGVTAEFNRNVLRVINRELRADFDPDAFDHVARWDPDEAWIEMRLRSTRAQTVHVAALDLTADFEADEGDAHRDLGEVPAVAREDRTALRGTGPGRVVDRRGRRLRSLARPAGLSCPRPSASPHYRRRSSRSPSRWSYSPTRRAWAVAGGGRGHAPGRGADS